MDRNAIPANGEALPVSRRQLLGATLAGTALAAAAFVPPAVGALNRPAAPAQPADPIIDAIDAFYRGNVAFEQIKEADWPAHGGEAAVVRTTYGTPLAALETWREPARTRAGAIHALRFAHREASEVSAEPTILAMLAAALAYFDAEQA